MFYPRFRGVLAPCTAKNAGFIVCILKYGSLQMASLPGYDSFGERILPAFVFKRVGFLKKILTRF